MDFLKELLGDDLFSQVESKINEHNGNEANKEKQIKLANLGGGDYVAKGKYDSEIEKLNNLLNGKSTELNSAYETQVADLQKQLQETQIKAALKVALLSEKALDVDYLTYKVNEKLQEQGKTLELDENENIKGWDELKSDLKTQFPAQFETGASNSKGREIDPNPLPRSEKREGFTKEELLKKPYAERQKFYDENPDAYNEIMKS